MDRDEGVAQLFPDLVDDYVCFVLMQKYEVSRDMIKKRILRDEQEKSATVCHHGANRELPSYIIKEAPAEPPKATAVALSLIPIGYADASKQRIYRFYVGQCPDCAMVHAFYAGAEQE